MATPARRSAARSKRSDSTAASSSTIPPCRPIAWVCTPRWPAVTERVRSVDASVAAVLADPAVKVVALTPADEFAAGHIPGAAQIDWPELEIVETVGPVGRDLARRGREQLDRRSASRAPTRSSSTTAARSTRRGSGGSSTSSATRDRRILNGGLPAWVEAGGELENGRADGRSRRANPTSARRTRRRSRRWPRSRRRVDDPNAAAGRRAHGRRSTRDGHIPGAVNVEFTDNAVAGRRPQYWKTRRGAAGDVRGARASRRTRRVIPYCTTGVRSAATYFTLRLLGYEDVALFTGSWKEWSATRSYRWRRDGAAGRAAVVARRFLRPPRSTRDPPRAPTDSHQHRLRAPESGVASG